MPPPNKKRRVMPAPKLTGPRPEEISFDLSARKEYLTGFHKRKVQRTKAAQEAAERRAKEEKRLQRNKLRDERKRELEERVKVVDAYMKPALGEGGSGDIESDSDGNDEADQVSDNQPLEKIDHEAEYVDEDKYTSVVVEEVGVDRDGFVRAGGSEQSDDEPAADDSTAGDQTVGTRPTPTVKRKWTHDKPKDAASKAKMKRKKFRYESKAERKAERDKQKAKNSKQAKARRAQ
ncbi:uncharacterized protein HMPREF1541_06487 [Cyphellophora europaea CBS 101466]|uniref:Ribosomal RNA-processing protein 17 n=1 Tax=Cyphellophora europaea (strain CBS 101466) TaxID=1220924 RepID=W2RPR4_CYPE1|nr:uncharacterized protein HMPREF1541_06487 [Cyphellophora europaea CBS 101466]ETN38452.1 hypothetical protein HMPREF1541_06487 [Cyphellophora europaea CBS 101466]